MTNFFSFGLDIWNELIFSSSFFLIVHSKTISQLIIELTHFLDEKTKISIFALFHIEIFVFDEVDISDKLFFILQLFQQFLSLSKLPFLQQNCQFIQVDNISLFFRHFAVTFKALIEHSEYLMSMLDLLTLSEE